MNEEMNKALIYFGRKDLTDGLYENNIDDNVQVFLTIRQMIKLYNLQSKIDKAIEVIDLITPELWNISNKMTYRLKDVKNILKEDK